MKIYKISRNARLTLGYLFVLGSNLRSGYDDEDNDYFGGIIAAYFPLMLILVSIIILSRLDAMGGYWIMPIFWVLSISTMVISYFRYGNKRTYERINRIIYDSKSNNVVHLQIFSTLLYLFALAAIVFALALRRGMIGS